MFMLYNCVAFILKIVPFLFYLHDACMYYASRMCMREQTQVMLASYPSKCQLTPKKEKLMLLITKSYRWFGTPTQFRFLMWPLVKINCPLLL